MRCALLALAFLAVAPCAAAERPPSRPAPGRLLPDVTCTADETQSYSLYLPSSYEPGRRWPVLLVFDPRGRSIAAAELFVDAAEELGWIILSSYGTRSDTSMEPNRRAVNALWREIHDRYPVDTGRIYAAGFSGTAYLAVKVGLETGALAGAILAGGRYFADEASAVEFPVFGAVGTRDFNNRDMRLLHARLSEREIPNRLREFDGGHSWMPAAVARTGMVWLQLDAMRTGLISADRQFISRAYQEDLDTVEKMVSTDRLLSAQRLLESMASDYEGLHDLAEISARSKALSQDPRIAEMRSVEQRRDTFEVEYTNRMQRVLRDFLATEPAPPPARLARELDLTNLSRRARQSGAEGESARRLLSAVEATTSLYLYRDLMVAGRPNHAASAIGVACRIDDENPVFRYNLACALSMAGRRRDALNALEDAMDRGFGDFGLMTSDPDLDAIRGTDRYGDLLSRLSEAERGHR